MLLISQITSMAGVLADIESHSLASVGSLDYDQVKGTRGKIREINLT